MYCHLHVDSLLLTDDLADAFEGWHGALQVEKTLTAYIPAHSAEQKYLYINKKCIVDVNSESKVQSRTYV